MSAPSTTVTMNQETRLYTPVLKQADALRIAWVYPAIYSFAMSSLGYLLLFAQLDQNPLAEPERFSSETIAQANLRNSQLMGFSFSFELDILEILKAFETTSMPFNANERGEEWPLVFCGGPVPMTNPEPYAPFFDFFLIGEGEELLTETITVLHRVQGLSKQEQLKALASEVEGVYVPSLIDVEYETPDGPIKGFHPTSDTLPFPIKRRFVENLDGFVAASPILSPEAYFSNSHLVEVMRGCSHRCRFCLASYSMLPTRGATLQPIIDKIEQGLAHTDRLGLLGALVADHPEFDALMDYLDTYMDQVKPIRISTGALRADRITPKLCNTLAKSGSEKLTIAIETGSEALRKRINKHLSTDAIFSAAETVLASNLKGMKLYFMAGLPGESDADLDASIELIQALKKQYKQLKLTVGCSTFVPKAWTPFQWQERMPTKVLEQRHQRFKKGLLKVADFRPSSPKWDQIQAVLSRGDRRLAPLLVEFYRLGGSAGSLKRAFKQWDKPVPSIDWYGNRARPQEEILPWDKLELSVPKDILWKEGQLGI